MPRATAELAYLFRHALLREAAYELQLPEARARMHALVVEIVEEILDDDDQLNAAASEIADHAQAAAIIENESDRFLQKELNYRHRALEFSGRRYEHAGVIEAGLRIIDHPSATGKQRSEAARNTGLAHMYEGRPDSAIEFFRKSRELAETDRDRGRALVAEADTCRNTGRFDEAERLFAEAVELLRPSADDAYAEALRQYAAVFLMQGQNERGRELAQEALEMSLQAGDTLGAARAEINLGVLDMRTGRPDSTEQRFNHARELAEQAGSTAVLALSLENLGALMGHTGRAREAMPFLEQALKLARQLGDRMLMTSILLNTGHAHAEAEQFAEAEAAMLEAIDLAHLTMNPAKLAVLYGNLAVVYSRTGRAEESMRLTRKSIEMHSKGGNRGAECSSRLNLADALFEAGDYDEALKENARADELAAQLQDPRMQGYAVCNRVMFQARKENRRPDMEAWERGIELIKKSGDTSAIERYQQELKDRFPE